MATPTTPKRTQTTRKPEVRRMRQTPSDAPRSQTTVEVRTKTPAPRGLEPRTIMYATVGASELALAAMRDVSGKMIAMTRDPGEIQRDVQSLSERLTADVTKVLGGLAERGEHLVSSIQRSTYTKRALDQARVARSQAKAATTSVRKAVDTATVAVKEAAGRIG
jgi:hypothetical protein